MAIRTAIIALLLDEEVIVNKKDKKTWVCPRIVNRHQFGSFHTLHKELELDN